MRHAPTLALVATMSACAGPQVATADLPDTRTMMSRVEAILVANHYPDAYGYARGPAPTVVMVPSLPDRHWGEYLVSAIKLSKEQPEACVPVTLAEEIAHDATVRMGLISLAKGAPAWFVKEEFERIGALVAAHVASDGQWLPGCIMRHGVE